MAKFKSKCKIKAVLRTNLDDMCIFCSSVVDDELIYGNFYTLQDISCHYFCVLLSSCAMQHGTDEQGLFGFLYSDIKEEAERGQKHRCSYCHKLGATLGCSVSQCRKQFHLPCGRERNAVSVFHGNYKSFCELHVPKQQIPESIMEIAKTRRPFANKGRRSNVDQGNVQGQEMICVICCEPVPGYPSPESFWPPCCAKDVWFHRLCIQKTALSAGIHYLKCPLCNDKDMFHRAVVSQGFYVPDRDASWELEQNAFNDMYERPSKCIAEECACPQGREHNADDGQWELRVCLLCGAGGAHAGCSGVARFVCAGCGDITLDDLDHFADRLETVRLQESTSRRRTRRGPVMPSRMSIRRTKPNACTSNPSTSNAVNSPSSSNIKPEELLENKPNKLNPQKLFSPIKLLDDRIQSKITSFDIQKTEKLVARMRDKFIRPMPLTKKRKIITYIIEDLLADVMSPIKAEEIKQLSPAKRYLNSDINKINIPKFSLENVKVKENITSKTETVDKIHEIINTEIKTTENTTTDDKPEIYDNETNVNNNKENNNKNLIVTKTEDIVTEDEHGLNDKLKFVNSNNTLKISTENIVTEDKEPNNKQINVNNKKFKEATNENIVIEDPYNKKTNVINNKLEVVTITTKNTQDTHELTKKQSNIINNKENNNKLNIALNEDKETNVNNNKENNDHKLIIITTENIIKDQESKTNQTNIINNKENNNKLKTIDIEQNSSLEISESDESIHVDVIQVDATPNSIIKDFLQKNIPDKCSLKFGALDKEILDDESKNIDMESFKNRYLTEVDKNNFKCNFNHKHEDKKINLKVNSVISFAVNAANKNIEGENITDEEKLHRKRKLIAEEHIPKKKHKSKHKNKKSKLIKIKLKKKKKKSKKDKQNNKIHKTPIKVLNESPKTFTQTVLNFSPENEIVLKSPNKKNRIKRKSFKNNTQDDQLKQTNLLSFFLVKND